MDNRAVLCGEILREPVFSHNIGSSDMYTAIIGVQRLSGAIDEVPLLFSAQHLPHMRGKVCIEGKLRGYTRQVDDRRRLHLMVLVKAVSEEQPQDNNRIELRATLFKDPVYRQTPLGREISDLLIRVPRERGGDDYIPSIVWGGCARFSQTLKKGDALEILGRMQSRKYMKQLPDGSIEERTAYELSINRLNKLDCGINQYPE